ncbi:MAG: phosphatidate cytidylyltransferase [Verrucomicrobiota bacterium]
MIRRFISFLILWSVVLALVFSQFIAGTVILIACLGLFAQWEFYRMQERKGFKIFKKAGLACGLLLFLISYFIFKKDLRDVGLGLEITAIMLVILGTLTRQIFERDQSNAVVTVGLTLLGFFYVPYLFNFVLKILLWKGPEVGFFLIVYLVAVTKLTDVGAYLVGSLIGRHKMHPRISPKKTWEGFFGGIAFSMLASVLLYKALSIDVFHSADAWWLGAILGVVSVVGDLGESVIKRDAQSKDSGDLIPGIGGSLDLIDSLLFTAPVFYAYLTIFFVR